MPPSVSISAHLPSMEIDLLETSNNANYNQNDGHPSSFKDFVARLQTPSLLSTAGTTAINSSTRSAEETLNYRQMDILEIDEAEALSVIQVSNWFWF